MRQECGDIEIESMQYDENGNIIEPGSRIPIDRNVMNKVIKVGIDGSDMPMVPEALMGLLGDGAANGAVDPRMDGSDQGMGIGRMVNDGSTGMDGSEGMNPQLMKMIQLMQNGGQ